MIGGNPYRMYRMEFLRGHVPLHEEIVEVPNQNTMIDYNSFTKKYIIYGWFKSKTDANYWVNDAYKSGVLSKS